MHADAFAGGARVLIHDDLLATGGTAHALAELVGRLGGEVVACVFLVELESLRGAQAARGLPGALADPVRLSAHASARDGQDHPQPPHRRHRQRRVWEVVSDPHHLPRWWPGVARVEDVRGERFTEVIPTRRGKPVRLDFIVSSSPTPPRRRAWTQELAGTPFERLLSAWTTTVTLAPEGDDGCLVTLEEHQQLRGSFRAGLLLQRRPAAARGVGAVGARGALLSPTGRCRRAPSRVLAERPGEHDLAGLVGFDCVSSVIRMR